MVSRTRAIARAPLAASRALEYLTLAARETRFWAEFCGRVDRPDLIARQYPRDVCERGATIHELMALLRPRERRLPKRAARPRRLPR